MPRDDGLRLDDDEPVRQEGHALDSHAQSQRSAFMRYNRRGRER